ncbi:MAG: glutathione S-transferase family protein [Sneathiella sp.]|nr:glutathione S-transferase family protein [Sneathiella sp.]
MVKIVSLKICPFVQRITALLEAKNISYEIEYISLGNKPDWFLDISPNGQVPILITEMGSALFESDAIAEYLDEISPPLEEDLTSEQRALNRAWSYLGSKHYLVQCSAMQSRDLDTLQERRKKLDPAFLKAEKKLKEGPFFNGKKIGNVDMAWLPLLHRAAIIEQHSAYDFLADFPKVKRWQRGLLDTGLCDKSVASDFEDVFASGYLSKTTYLGGCREPQDPINQEQQSAGCC